MHCPYFGSSLVVAKPLLDDESAADCWHSYRNVGFVVAADAYSSWAMLAYQPDYSTELSDSVSVVRS